MISMMVHQVRALSVCSGRDWHISCDEFRPVGPMVFVMDLI